MLPFPPTHSAFRICPLQQSMSTGGDSKGLEKTQSSHTLPLRAAHVSPAYLMWVAGEPYCAHPRGLAKVSPGDGLQQGLPANTGWEPFKNSGMKAKKKGEKKKKKKKI